jgi:predicted nucleotidyltransferase
VAPSVFKILSDIFKKHNVLCILIGGYAVNSYKVTRHTADIDFLTTQESFNKIKADLFDHGYTLQHQQEVFVQLVNNQGYRDLDFMFTDASTFNKLLEHSRTTLIAGEQFQVPSLENLIALKLHSIKFNPQRELHDLPDIVNLIRTNKVNYESKEFQLLCVKFGNSSLHNKILDYLKST